MQGKISRRNCLAIMGTGAAATTANVSGLFQNQQQQPQFEDVGGDTRAARMKWWHEAKFGMFIHWGLYSVLGRHEWSMENEGIPVKEYEQLAQQFKPKPVPAKDWARLAKFAGMKYMVMTSKHHEGFCLFDTKSTSYCAPKQAAARDLAKEYLQAARDEGLRAGFYYSLMDWHHPDGALCATDESARRRFVDYIHGHVRELCTNYGKLDILWYDVSWPLDPKGWESERMNKMVFELQPEIIVNNRNGLPGDFSTPEQTIRAEQAGRAWESCMTMNESWGYNIGDDAWKSPKQVIRNLGTCARDGGNYLLNIGPEPDGSIPEESVRILSAVGEWITKNGEAIYGTERCQVRRSNIANFTRKGNTLYIHVHFWPGETVAIGGLKNKVKSARLLAGGPPVTVVQEDLRVQFKGLPKQAPGLVPVIVAECEGEPVQDMMVVRKGRKREGV
ncbi:MAG: alpha-L-fucosidase [Acidobacteria bacterium]|nr:MAG: alpha-L-fucosidase [Acidobacteriota bacterium]